MRFKWDPIIITCAFYNAKLATKNVTMGALFTFHIFIAHKEKILPKNQTKKQSNYFKILFILFGNKKLRS